MTRGVDDGREGVGSHHGRGARRAGAAERAQVGAGVWGAVARTWVVSWEQVGKRRRGVRLRTRSRGTSLLHTRGSNCLAHGRGINGRSLRVLGRCWSLCRAVNRASLGDWRAVNVCEIGERGGRRGVQGGLVRVWGSVKGVRARGHCLEARDEAVDGRVPHEGGGEGVGRV